jgi:hypothetical protein
MWRHVIAVALGASPQQMIRRQHLVEIELIKQLPRACRPIIAEPSH